MLWEVGAPQIDGGDLVTLSEVSHLSEAKWGFILEM